MLFHDFVDQRSAFPPTLMAPVHYTGALQPKKKLELQEIALALDLNDQGTKDELQSRIKKHLDDHQSELEDDPIFAGLLGRRKRSVQPPSTNPSACVFILPHTHYLYLISPYAFMNSRAPDSSAPSEPKPSSRAGRRTALEPVPEATPAKDLRDVSAYLKHPISPVESTPNKSPRRAEVPASPISASSLPPLPPSPASPTKSLIETVKTAADASAIVQNVKQYDVRRTIQESLVALRAVCLEFIIYP